MSKLEEWEQRRRDMGLVEGYQRQPSPRIQAPSGYNDDWRDQLAGKQPRWQECHNLCAALYIGAGYGSDASLRYRRCMRECLGPPDSDDY